MIGNSRLSALALVAAVLTAAVAPSAAAAGGVAVQSDDAQPLTVAQDDEVEITEVNQSWTVAQGDEVTVELDIGNATDGTLTFGDENETNYEATATVEDTNGNGTVIVVLDTGSLGVDSIDDGLQAGPGTAISNASQTSLEEQLSPYEYDLTLEADGESTDSGLVSITSDESDDSNSTDTDEESNSTDEETASNESTENDTSTDANATDDPEEDGGFALPGFGAPVALAVLGSIVAIGARRSRSQ